jgi:hypothetical protein
MLTRFLFQRALALTYLIAFLVALNQFRPLLGERGLLPVPAYVKYVTFREAPSLFLWWPRDTAFAAAAWLGIALSCFALLGFSDRYSTWLSMLTWALLYALYLSFVNVGQTFYGFGWESLLLESGFFAIFLGSRNTPPEVIMSWLIRWILFRVMFGAGLIKLRGDPCWRDMTCLDYHYETQPMPNPLSWFFHWAPLWTHRAGVWFNHFAELVVPFGYFLPQPISGIAGLITILFQLSIMASGNLSWLNFLTMVLAIPTLDERWLAAIFPFHTPEPAPNLLHKYTVFGLAALTAILSIAPVVNMISPRQIMNFSYNPFHIVGTYGAFGSITHTRYEIVIEGSSDGAQWREYEFKGKPGDPARMPPQIAPYHLRLDWLMWFAAMSNYREHPWFVNLVTKLLEGDAATLSLLRTNPFPQAPPKWIRARMYEYQFTTPAERKSTGLWWTRRLAGEYFPTVSHP